MRAVIRQTITSLKQRPALIVSAGSLKDASQEEKLSKCGTGVEVTCMASTHESRVQFPRPASSHLLEKPTGLRRRVRDESGIPRGAPVDA